jgi:hypothetical protein
MVHRLPKRIEWGAHEHEHQEKTPDWYWALGLVALVGFIGSLLLGNVLLAIVILLGGLVMGLYATLHPHYAEFALTHRGVIIEEKLYPYQTLDSFWIDDIVPEKPKLLIKSQKIMMPLMVLPIPDDIDPEIIHRYLLQYLQEEENNEPIAHRLIEALGF